MGKLTAKSCPGGCGDVRERYADDLCWNCTVAIRKWRELEERRKKEDQGVFEIEGEKTYPIWSIELHWLEDIPADAEPAVWYKRGDPPSGRFWNSSQWYKMFPAEVPDGDVIRHAYKEAQKRIAHDKQKAANASDPIAVVRFVRREVWCIGWFSHHTLDVGQTDKEVLDSFRKYVERTQAINAREGKKVDGYWREPHCLMGAEDRWRWCGSGDGGDPDMRTDPPCRCKHCKEQGVIRIGH